MTNAILLKHLIIIINIDSTFKGRNLSPKEVPIENPGHVLLYQIQIPYINIIKLIW